jgi:hypothetical protein
MISRWNIRSGGGRVGSVVHGANSAIASDISAQGDRSKRREFLGVLAGATSAWPGFAFAQQNQPPKRVGLLANLPPLYPFREYANVGGLFIYGANISVLFGRAADYLDKLLKGEKIANLPVQQATAFELIVNARTASALGLNLPPNILLRADEVIE